MRANGGNSSTRSVVRVPAAVASDEARRVNVTGVDFDPRRHLGEREPHRIGGVDPAGQHDVVHARLESEQWATRFVPRERGGHAPIDRCGVEFPLRRRRQGEHSAPLRVCLEPYFQSCVDSLHASL
jgi:hypothetical protein